MASTDKTPKLGLNVWAGTDVPVRTDFVADNQKIDDAIAGLEDGLNNLDEQVTQVEEAVSNKLDAVQEDAQGNEILYIQPSTNKVVPGAKLDVNGTYNTVPIRGTGGILKVGNAVSSSDAVNLGQMRDALENIAPATPATAQVPLSNPLTESPSGSADTQAEMNIEVKTQITDLWAAEAALQEEIEGIDYIPSSEKGVANGIASLGADGLVPLAQLPDMGSGGGGLSPTGNGSSLTVAATAAGTRANLATGDTLSTIAGKLMKWFADFKAVAFSGLYSDLTGAPTSMTPTAHASTHASGGGDAVTPSGIGAANATHTHTQSDVTDLATALAGKLTTPTFTGMAKGTGSGLSAAVVGTDYANSIKASNISASTWVADATYAEYGYRCNLTVSGVTSAMQGEVVFGLLEAVSGDYAPICTTGTNIVTIYSKVNTAITVPTVRVWM